MRRKRVKEIPGYTFDEYSECVEFLTLLSKAFESHKFEIKDEVDRFTIKAAPEFTINNLRTLLTYDIARATYVNDGENNSKPIN